MSEHPKTEIMRSMSNRYPLPRVVEEMLYLAADEVDHLRARLAEAEAGHEMTRRELQRYQSHVHDADGLTAQAAQRALDATARAEAAEAKLA
ncbi:hypothetical protein, partial [Sporichthya brevicatena]|uniref:hypothetical protein n=1 Tax=Sporichthya brevicatena TaxID=171442 RepID=UPI0031DD1079